MKGTSPTGTATDTAQTSSDLEALGKAHRRAKNLIYRAAVNDFACFSRAVIKDEETRAHVTLAPHQLEWLDHIDRCLAAGKFAGILAPPSSGKSQLFAVGYPLWQMGRDQTVRIVVVGSDDELVKARVRPAKDYLQADPDYKTIFPNASPEDPEKWTEQKFSVRRPKGIKDPTYQGRGIMSPPHGARADLIINDDICTYRNTISEPAMREKVIDSWYNGFDTRMGPDSFCLHIGGVIHSRDLNNRLMQDPRFWFIRQSIGDDFSSLVQEDITTGQRKQLPLWGRAWTPEFLKAKHDSNPRAYKRAYQHVGYSDEERTFKESSVKAAIRKPGSPVPPGAIKYMGVDISGRSRKGNVIATIAVTEKRIALEIECGAWSSDETGRKILAAYERHHPYVIMVENNAYQQALIDWMRAVVQSPLPIEPFTTGKQKADETLGIPGLAAEFENGMWELPFPEDHIIGMGCSCGMCALFTQLVDHPFGMTDCVMALWFARFAAIKCGTPVVPTFVEAPPLGREAYRGSGQESRLSRFRSSRKGMTTS